MKVLFAGGNGYYPEFSGGAQSSTHHLVQQLRQRGHEAAVLATLLGVDRFGLQTRVKMKLLRQRAMIDSFPGYPVVRAWRPWEEVAFAVDRFRPEVAVIHCQKAVPIGKALQAEKVPTVVYLRNVQFDELGGDLAELPSALYIANSRFTAQTYKEAFGVESVVIPPTVNPLRYRTATTGDYVTFINPFVQKGFEKAVDIAALCPDIPFLFVESWTLAKDNRARVEEKIRPLKNVRLENRTSDMKTVYSRTKILLAPSLWNEAWGRVASEAHCSGIPVVGSRRGGLPEAIGEGGIVLDYDAPLEDWVGAVRRLWDDAKEYAQLSAAARRFSQRPEMDPERQFTAFLSVLDQAAATTVKDSVRPQVSQLPERSDVQPPPAAIEVRYSPMNYRSIADMNDTIVRNLHRLPRDIDLVVGVPRSGLLAATIFSLATNIPMTDLDSFVAGKTFSSGITKRRSALDRTATEARRVLVIDDSINGGTAMAEARAKVAAAGLAGDIIFAAVYGAYPKFKETDFIFEVVPWPRLFQWNFMHHKFLAESCVDIDGVLCVDPTDEENDDGQAYERFLVEARPLYMPTRKIAYLVTSRLEKYRPQTEAWLSAHGLAYDKLIMLDLPSKEARQRMAAHGSFKAEFYRASDAILFIESEYDQALKIAELSGKPVLCLETHQMISPGMTPLQAGLHYARTRDGRQAMLKATARAILGERSYEALKRRVRRPA